MGKGAGNLIIVEGWGSMQGNWKIGGALGKRRQVGISSIYRCNQWPQSKQGASPVCITFWCSSSGVMLNSIFCKHNTYTVIVTCIINTLNVCMNIRLVYQPVCNILPEHIIITSAMIGQTHTYSIHNSKKTHTHFLSPVWKSPFACRLRWPSRVVSWAWRNTWWASPPPQPNLGTGTRWGRGTPAFPSAGRVDRSGSVGNGKRGMWMRVGKWGRKMGKEQGGRCRWKGEVGG